MDIDYDLLAEEYNINSGLMFYSDCPDMDEEEKQEMPNRQKEIEKTPGFYDYYQQWLARKNDVLARKKN
jgi:hypothetical protein